MERITLLNNTKQETRIIEEQIRNVAARADGKLIILEAGCGQKWPLKLEGIDRFITGVDIDEAALALRKAKHNDLHEIVIGDLRTLDLPANHFDVIYTSYVLEHIENINKVLTNFTLWLKPGGLIVIKVPDRYTVYGFLARLTPHWLHVSYYRYIKGKTQAGKPGHAPYPIVYDPELSRGGIKAFCAQNGLQLSMEMGKNNYLRKRSKKDKIVGFFARTLSALSMGKLAWRYNDVIFIIQKPAS